MVYTKYSLLFSLSHHVVGLPGGGVEQRSDGGSWVGDDGVASGSLGEHSRNNRVAFGESGRVEITIPHKLFFAICLVKSAGIWESHFRRAPTVGFPGDKVIAGNGDREEAVARFT